MIRRTAPGVALALVLLAADPARSGDLGTDAFIVTGIDISDSVPAADIRAELAALADAVRAPAFVAAIGRGPNGRVALAVFAWHHHRFEILPWTAIGSASDAEAAARQIENRIPVNVDSEARRASARFIGRLTDLSGALDHAAGLLGEAGTPDGGGVVNILGNGADNMGEPAAPARARLLASGATVNGVVFGGDPEVADYYRAEVVGGGGAFLIAAGGPEPLAETMRRKLLRDLVAGVPVAVR